MLHALKSIILPRKDPAEDLDGGMILGKVHKEPFMRALSSPIISNSGIIKISLPQYTDLSSSVKFWGYMLISVDLKKGHLTGSYKQS